MQQNQYQEESLQQQMPTLRKKISNQQPDFISQENRKKTKQKTKPSTQNQQKERNNTDQNRHKTEYRKIIPKSPQN